MSIDVGIGLPTLEPGISRKVLIDWMERAEESGFASLGLHDRLAYRNYEPLITLAAAAVVTEEIRLTTTALVLPYRMNAVMVAKQVATLQQLSAGRVVLGVGLGPRSDDYAVSGMEMVDLAPRYDDMLRTMRRTWTGDSLGQANAIGPPPDPIPPVIVAGQAPGAFRRAAEHDGWMLALGGPDEFAAGAAKLGVAWDAAGRAGSPRTIAIIYFGLGPRAKESAAQSLGDAFAWIGEMASQIVASAATDEATIAGAIAGFEAAGCDELILLPTSADPEQVDLLASVVR